MSPSPHSAPGCAWTVHTVHVRTRDGPERLALVYRRLLQVPAGESPPPQADRLAAEALERR
jgi:hypothetical protein